MAWVSEANSVKSVFSPHHQVLRIKLRLSKVCRQASLPPELTFLVRRTYPILPLHLLPEVVTDVVPSMFYCIALTICILYCTLLANYFKLFMGKYILCILLLLL